MVLKSNITSVLLAPIIDSIRPLNANAGTDEIVTIYGNNFSGLLQELYLRKAGDVCISASTFLDNFTLVPSSEIVNWTNTVISFKPHSNFGDGVSGTGIFRVYNSTSTFTTSSMDLTIDYAVFQEFDGVSYNPVYYDKKNAQNGYTIYYNNTVPADARMAIERAISKFKCEHQINITLACIDQNIVNPSLNSPDNINLIHFDNAGVLPSTAYAAGRPHITSVTSTSNNYGVLSEFDLFIKPDPNPTTMSNEWNYNVSCPTGDIDLETVVLHELGHCFLLGHVNESSELMHCSNPSAPYSSSSFFAFQNITDYADSALLFLKKLTIDSAHTYYVADTSCSNIFTTLQDIQIRDCPCDNISEPNTINCTATNATCSDNIGWNSIYASQDIWNKTSVVSDFTTVDKTHQAPTFFDVSFNKILV